MDKTGKGIFEAMNAHDSKKLAGFYTDGATLKVAGLPDMTGKDAIGQTWQRLFDAFPDFKTGASRVWVKNDIAVMEWAMTGTHQGELFGIKGTEKKVGVQGCDVIWFTPEGQIKEHHTYYDGGTILSQIGVSPQKVRAIPAVPASPQMITGNSPDEAKNADMVKATMTAMDTKKEADFLANVSDTVEYDDMTQEKTSKGKAEAKKFFKEFTTGFPDSKTTFPTTITVGDWVITENQWTGTHKGSFFGMPATKKTVNMRGVDIFQFKDGKMVKGWSYSNSADFMQQLGKMQKPGAAKAADPKAAAAGAKPADPKAAAPAAKPAADPKAAPAKK
jgi:steroid delta-isomerase-like uncharacterized protein